MDEELRRRLAQMGRMSLNGILGEAIQASAEEYQRIPDGIPIFLKVIGDFYQQKEADEDKQMKQIADLFSQLIILVYRDYKSKGVEVAKSIAESFIKDFPGAKGSCLFSRWDSLGKAALAFKAVSRTNLLLVWQQAKDVVLAYNEFLNGLLGFLIVGWRCALGRSYSANVFNNAYGAKSNEFSELTGGEDGAFYVICRLAKPHLRNAIAHGSIWLDTDENKVKFEDGIQTKTSYELDLVEFVCLAAIGSHLPQAYLAAIASIVVLEEGNAAQLAQMPRHLVRMFRHRPPG